RVAHHHRRRHPPARRVARHSHAHRDVRPGVCQPPAAPAAFGGLRSSMAEFSIRSDSVDVEQIMKQIRGRIAEKRGVDYTEEQIRELANVRLEKFLDPKNLRSDLL